MESPDLLPGMGRSGWDPWDTLRRTLWLRQQRFDIIHTVDTRPAVCLPALFARRKAGAKWIADWTDWWGRGGATEERKNKLANTIMGPLEQLFEEKPRPYADGTVVISRALGARAEGLGIPARPSCTCRPGPILRTCDTRRSPRPGPRFASRRKARSSGTSGTSTPATLISCSRRCDGCVTPPSC